MAGTGQSLILPTINELVELNRRLIFDYGGDFFEADGNLANRGSLEHALAAMQVTLFGHELYPTLFDKAALLGWRIIAGHVFHDGNKRTGMAACRSFLLANGCRLPISMEMVNVAVSIAQAKMTMGEFKDWLESQARQTIW